jgi:hypothetical protein
MQGCSAVFWTRCCAAWWTRGIAAGAEIDLVLERPRARRLAFEIELASAPKPSRGFWSGLADLRPSAAYVVYSGKERHPLGKGVEALPVSMLAGVLDD